MSYYPPSPDPRYLGYNAPPPQRPGVVTAISVIAIVMGLLMGLCMPFGIVPDLLKVIERRGWPAFSGPSGLLLISTLVALVVLWLAAIIGFVAAIFSLKLKRAGRVWMIISAGLLLGQTITQYLIMGWMTWPHLERMSRFFTLSESGPKAVGQVIGHLYGTLYPIWVLIAFTRPGIKAAFLEQPSTGFSPLMQPPPVPPFPYQPPQSVLPVEPDPNDPSMPRE